MDLQVSAAGWELRPQSTDEGAMGVRAESDSTGQAMQRLPQYCLQLDRESSNELRFRFVSSSATAYSHLWRPAGQDDQDVEIGGWNPMKQTQALLQKNGGLLTNWRIHTPICSPSRSETVSGRYCKLRNP